MCYPTGYEHSSLGVPGTSCICDTCCGNNCDWCQCNPELGYDAFEIEEAYTKYWETKLGTSEA